MSYTNKDLVSRCDTLDKEFSVLTTLILSKTKDDWHEIPISEFIILGERFKTIDKAIKDIYEVLNKYDEKR